MGEETKMVEGAFGKMKPITRAEFVRRWVVHVEQVYLVARTNEDADTIRFAVRKVAEMAGRQWDVL